MMDFRNNNVDKLSNTLLSTGIACSPGEARRMAESMAQTEVRVQERFQANRETLLRRQVKKPIPDNPAYLRDDTQGKLASHHTRPLYTDDSRANLTALWNNRPSPSEIASMKQRAAHPNSQAQEMRERALAPKPVQVQSSYQTPQSQVQSAIPRSQPAPAQFSRPAPVSTSSPMGQPVRQPAPQVRSPIAPTTVATVAAQVSAPTASAEVAQTGDITLREIMSEDAQDIYEAQQFLDEISSAMADVEEAPQLPSPVMETLTEAPLEPSTSSSYNYSNSRLDSNTSFQTETQMPEQASEQYDLGLDVPAQNSAIKEDVHIAPVLFSTASPHIAAPVLQPALTADPTASTSSSSTTASIKDPGKIDAPEAKVDLSEMFNFGKR